MSKGDGYETVDEGVGDTSGLKEKEEKGSLVDIDDTPGMSGYEGGVGVVGKRVEAVARSGRWTGCFVYSTHGGRVTGVGRYPSQNAIRLLYL